MFESGVLVVQSLSHSEEAIIEDSLKQVFYARVIVAVLNIVMVVDKGT